MKQNKLLCFLLPGLLVLLLLSALYAASPSFPGTRFDEEVAGHVGILLEDHGILTSDEDAVLVDGSTATIVKGGEYRLTGSLEDGQIIINAPEEEQVVLKLDSVVLHCEHSAPIWAKSADRVKLSLPEDSVSILSDGSVHNQPEADAALPTACVYAQCDLTVKGKGQLIVDARFRNGIASTDSLYLKNGVVSVTAPRTALRGKDDVTMVGGILDLKCGDSAVTSAGFVDLQGGELRIDTDGSAIHAVTGVTVAEAARVQAHCALLPVQCAGPIRLAYPIAETEGA